MEQFVRMRKRDRLFVIGNGENRIAACYSEDAVRAVVLAGTSSIAHGKVYDVASDEAVTQRRFLDAMADTTCLPRTRRRARFRVAYAVAFVADMLAKIPGCEPPYSRMAVMLMGTDQIIDATEIRDDLGWRPEVSFAEGMRRTAEWYQQTSMGSGVRRELVAAGGSTTE
jgi:nucleoside-diphosphate-sugar epimerase